MSDENFFGEFISGDAQPSRWAVTAFIASCTFAAGALLLLILS